jgi:hypothetical protein
VKAGDTAAIGQRIVQARYLLGAYGDLIESTTDCG